MVFSIQCYFYWLTLTSLKEYHRLFCVWIYIYRLTLPLRSYLGGATTHEEQILIGPSTGYVLHLKWVTVWEVILISNRTTCPLMILTLFSCELPEAFSLLREVLRCFACCFHKGMYHLTDFSASTAFPLIQWNYKLWYLFAAVILLGFRSEKLVRWSGQSLSIHEWQSHSTSTLFQTHDFSQESSRYVLNMGQSRTF